MKVVETIAVAFSMFSKIPMPQFEWNEKNMKYTMVAFPVIGFVIGSFCHGFALVMSYFPIPKMIQAIFLCSIPLWLTGGIHFDGFMDTTDAIASYRTRDRKLEIMKDPHVGSFAVVHAGLMLLWNFACWYSLENPEWFMLIGIFMMSRALSGLAVCCFPMAKDTGLAHTFQSESSRGMCRTVLFAILMGIAIGFILVYGIAGAITSAIGWVMYLIYYIFGKKAFGGITGDLAGWFVTVTEAALLIFYAVAQNFPVLW